MKKSIEVSEATALMMEALQKKYEAVCLATDAIDEFFGLSESSRKGMDEKKWEASKKCYSEQAERWHAKIYKSVWGFEDAMWGLLCIMAKDVALGEVRDGKIFNSI